MSNPLSKPRFVEVNPYRFWHARFWHGMLFTPWLRLVARNRARIGWTKWGLAFTVTSATVMNSLLRPLEKLFFQRRVRRTRMTHAPIFIIGHWRSGTTLLHELLVLDDRFTYPTTYECLAPNHFLISRPIFTRLKFLLPSKRPMDHMATGWDRPQEDEFALANMGLPSPYLTMAFPNEPPQCPGSLSLEGLSPQQLDQWKAGLRWFLTRVTLRHPRQIVLKSPPHTARIRTLLELFPDARFVHIVRDPHALFASTVKLWKTLYKFQALQNPNYLGLEEYVLSTFVEMYEKLKRDRDLVPPRRFFEVRYEDLVRDPIDQMRALYDQLDLGAFEQVLPKVRAYFHDRRDFQASTYHLDDQVRSQIERRWGPYLRQYGYCQTDRAAVGR